MKTSRELIERLNADKAFAKEFNEAVKAKRKSGAKDNSGAFISTAADFGYEISREELEAMAASSEEMSNEELSKLAGGDESWTYSFVCQQIDSIKFGGCDN